METKNLIRSSQPEDPSNVTRRVNSRFSSLRRSASLLTATGLAAIAPIFGLGLNAEAQAQATPMDIYVDHGYDFSEIVDWASKNIPAHINQKYSVFGIDRRISLENISQAKIGHDCEDITPHVENGKTGRIAFFISKDPSTIGWAQPYNNTICLNHRVFGEGFENGLDVLWHENLHLDGLPDYYMQDVLSYNNQVVPLGIESDVHDIMWKVDQSHAYLSSNSIRILNDSLLFPGNVEAWKKYVPKQFVLQITGNAGLPLPEVRVEVFPMKMKWTPNWPYPTNTIPNVSSFENITDGTGRVFLGGYPDIFRHQKLKDAPVNGLDGNTALLRVTHGDQIRYAGMTLTHLNTLFMEGKQNFATMSVPFSMLVSAPKKGEYTVLNAMFKTSEGKDLPTDERLMRDAHAFEHMKAAGLLDKLGENPYKTTPANK